MKYLRDSVNFSNKTRREGTKKDSGEGDNNESCTKPLRLIKETVIWFHFVLISPSSFYVGHYAEFRFILTKDSLDDKMV